MKKRKHCNASGLIGIVIFLGSFTQISAQTWSTTGNAGTSSSTNFVGTTDLVDFKIRTNNVERVTIGQNGFVGFGTSSSIGLANFVISSDLGGWGGMYANGAGSGVKPFYGYAINGTNLAWQYYDPTKSALILSVGSGDRLTVTSSGNVGIGTTAPSTRLDVSGNANVSGSFTAANGNFTGTLTATTFGSISSSGTGNFSSSVSAASFKTGAFTINSSGLSSTGGTTFTFTAEADFNGYELFANRVNGHTTDSGPGITGRAASSPSLLSFGVYGDANGSPNAYGVACSGNGYYTGNWYQLSDQKFKTNVTGLNGALNIINQLQPKQYEYKRDEYSYMNFPAGQQYGFIAQDVEKIAPFLVKESSQPVDMRKPDGEKIEFKMVNYIGLIPVLTEAIQEQQAIIEQQDSTIQQQDERLTRLENQVGQLSSGTTETKSAGTIQVNQLYPNQPNPFNQETVIKYTIDNNATNAAIVISDMQGTVQKSIALTQKGEGSITVQAQDLKPGLYSYVLVVDGKIADMKKMIITK